MYECGAESVALEVSATADEGGYEAMVTKAMARLGDMLPNCSVVRHRHECAGLDPARDAWYVSCAHSSISGGGTTIEGHFTFVRFGTEDE